jgi:hypothetical protein
MLKDGQLPRQTSIDKNIYQMVVCARWHKKNVDNAPHVPLFEKL